MKSVSGKWAGNITGTNSGKFFAELTQTGRHVAGEMRLNDDAVDGVARYAISGEVGDTIELLLDPIADGAGIQMPAGRVRAEIAPDGGLLGTWETNDNTKGALFAWKQALEVVPEARQAFTKEISIGSIRLYRSDLEALFTAIQTGFTEQRLVVSHYESGHATTKFVDEFRSDIPLLKRLRRLSLWIQERETSDIDRIVRVHLVETGASTIFVQGSDETWVLGTIQRILAILQRNENRVASFYRTRAGTLNMLVLLLLLVYSPEFGSLLLRFLFVLGVVGIVLGLYAVHNRLVPNTLIILDDEASTRAAVRAQGPLASLALGILASLVATGLYNFLQGHHWPLP